MFRDLLGEEEEGHGDLKVVVLPGLAPITPGHSLGETKRQKGGRGGQTGHSCWAWVGGGVLPDWRLESQALAQFTSQTPL